MNILYWLVLPCVIFICSFKYPVRKGTKVSLMVLVILFNIIYVPALSPAIFVFVEYTHAELDLIRHICVASLLFTSMISYSNKGKLTRLAIGLT